MTLTEITNDQDSRLDVYMRLSNRQLRSLVDPTQAKIIVESHIALNLVVNLGLDIESILIDKRHVESFIPEIEGKVKDEVPIYIADREVLSHIVGFEVTRGYFACVKRPKDASPKDLIADAKRIALLEGIVDTTNIGALFRSAAALGIDGLILSPNCADPYSRRSIRTSMGTVFQVPWATASGSWPKDTMSMLREQGFVSLALALDETAVSLSDPSLKKYDKLALCFGSEGWGLSKDVLAEVDQKVIIPMTHGVDSLNVAASSAVTFWELCKNDQNK